MDSGSELSRWTATSPEDVWRVDLHVVREFVETEPDYIALCREVAYILKARLAGAGLEVAAITWRSKALYSFIEKISRKTYQDPFRDITDRAGVRVVCNFRSECDEVYGVIASEFDVREIVDKEEELGVDRVGYAARHFVVELRDHGGTATYKGLSGLKCEIQVRSALQDAWAILQYHMVYKSEAPLPLKFQREMNILAASLEGADLQFEKLHADHLEYVGRLRSSTEDIDRLKLRDLDVASLRDYLLRRFPGRAVERRPGELGEIVRDLHRWNFRLVDDVDQVLSSASGEIERIASVVDGGIVSAAAARPSSYDAVWAAALQEESDLSGSTLPEEWRDAIETLRRARAAG